MIEFLQIALQSPFHFAGSVALIVLIFAGIIATIQEIKGNY